MSVKIKQEVFDMDTIVNMLKIQYEDSWNMLKSVVELCPDELWKDDNNGSSVWNNIIHTLAGIDFWLRLDYNAEFESGLKPFLPDNIAEKILNDEWCVREDGSMTKDQVRECFKIFDIKKDAFFNSLNDSMLSRKILDGMEFTYLSVICAQIRHIMCHVGICQEAVYAYSGKDIPWIAFGETAQ